MSRLRFGFCLAIAVIAAAIADPFVEFASNAGWFGPGNFTDHSSADIVPALLAGVSFLGLYMARKARAVLAGRVIPARFWRLLPAVFVLQLLTLYVMETIEQLASWGHILGATIWLGGPVPVSLTIHAAVGCAITCILARSGRRLASTTLKVIRLIGAIGVFATNVVESLAMRRFQRVAVATLLPLPCTIGERAPPSAHRLVPN